METDVGTDENITFILKMKAPDTFDDHRCIVLGTVLVSIW